jgi:biotin synthase
MIEHCIKIIQDGGELDFAQVMELAQTASLTSLCDAAAMLCRDIHGAGFDLCSIINARSGKCSEDCRYCAQSVHHHTNINIYEQIEPQIAISQARENDAYGVLRLSLVAAGRSLSTSQMDAMGSLYSAIADVTELRFCASMGFLTEETAKQLVSFGVRRYHCNLETCREFFPSICTTHSWNDKVETLKIARAAGMDLCSGGIIGMGESLENRLQLAFELRDLGVLSIPINILSPIESTPLAVIEAISLEDVLRCVALFRFVNPLAVIRIAGGRGRFEQDQYKMFAAGANGAIVGDYLSTAGVGVAEDLVAFSNLGFDVPGNKK